MHQTLFLKAQGSMQKREREFFNRQVMYDTKGIVCSSYNGTDGHMNSQCLYGSTHKTCECSNQDSQHRDGAVELRVSSLTNNLFKIIICQQR